MREFADITSQLGLEKYLDSALGTLHCGPAAPATPTVIVRHFDAGLPLALEFAGLLKAVRQWVRDRGDVAELVEVEQLLETGRDFVARPFHLYATATTAYTNRENPPEIPDELELMHVAFRAAAGASEVAIDVLVESVLARSLLQPSGKTYFNEFTERFVVVEPRVTREELERWAELAG